ncbi:predicted protein [Botrytis cinerea T4]|uniref:Uncharacterized protein n=1 Tax=Botryotinia fuckeliana (strain T4) TaxID=999810 RepID=G2YL59_BOTF4|nr:predicted protein [Botrytis cinerea T4]
MSQSQILPPILPISQFHHPKFHRLLGQGSFLVNAFSTRGSAAVTPENSLPLHALASPP